MQVLASYVSARWAQGTSAAQTLLNPATEEPLATASSAGIDVAAALDHARNIGGPGRAGGGEELGERRVLSFFMQRVALEGSRPAIAVLTKGSSAA